MVDGGLCMAPLSYTAFRFVASSVRYLRAAQASGRMFARSEFDGLVRGLSGWTLAARVFFAGIASRWLGALVV